MKLEKIFEEEKFIVYQDNKGYDFAFDIENKTESPITIQYGEYNEELKIDNWVGLFNDEEYIINCILNDNYIVRQDKE